MTRPRFVLGMYYVQPIDESWVGTPHYEYLRGDARQARQCSMGNAFTTPFLHCTKRIEKLGTIKLIVQVPSRSGFQDVKDARNAYSWLFHGFKHAPSTTIKKGGQDK